MDVNDKRLEVLRRSVEKTEDLINQLCEIRPDMSEIKSTEWLDKIKNIRQDMESEQMLLFIGEFSSGKSTFANALLGEDILPTAAKPCTCVVTELRFKEGGGHQGKMFKLDGNVEESVYEEIRDRIDGSQGVGKVAQCHHIELIFDVTQLENWESHPLATLKNLEVKVVDCPGYNSPYGANDSVIAEYIQKASYTFWMSPADRFGGAFAQHKLRDIRKKTTALIPVITMADKINAAQKDQVQEDFFEHLDDYFPHKDPIFVSAVNSLKANSLKKELFPRDPKKEPSPEEKKKLQEEIDALELKSGMEKVFTELINCGQKQTVTESKIKSALFDLSELFKGMERYATQEEAYWQKKLQEKGWSPDDKYRKLNEIKRNVNAWIKGEAKSVASRLEASMIKEITDDIMQAKGKVDANRIQVKIIERWEKELLDLKDKWAEHFQKEYSQYEAFSDSNSQLKLPALGSIADDLKNVILAVLDSLKFAGPRSVLMGGAGAAIWVAGGAAASVPLIGGALAAVAAFVGPALIIVAAVPLLPAIFDKIKQRKEQFRKEVEAKLKTWMKDLNFAPAIEDMLNKQNEKLYNVCIAQFDAEQQPLISGHERTQEIKNSIKETREDLAAQFPDEFRGKV